MHNKPKDEAIVKELRELSSGISDLDEAPLFKVPEGYFEELPALVLARAIREDHTDAVTSELEAVSPFLAEFPRHTPFVAPDNYFNRSDRRFILGRENPPSAKIIPLSKKLRVFKRCIAAAAIAGTIAVTAVFLFKNYSGNAMDRQLAQVSDQEIVDFLQYNTDGFDNDNIFANVSLEDNDMPSVLPEEMSNEEIDDMLEDNLLQEIQLNN